MYKINIVCVGNLKEKFYYASQSEYLKRLSKFCEINVFEVDENKLPQNPSISQIEMSLDKEYKVLLPYLKGKVIVCAIEGKEYTSEDFAKQIFKLFDECDTLTFVIGSSYGLCKKIKENNMLVSFSKMTFPHHLMRILLEEQIYRAFTIRNGNSYHK